MTGDELKLIRLHLSARLTHTHTHTHTHTRAQSAGTTVGAQGSEEPFAPVPQAGLLQGRREGQNRASLSSYFLAAREAGSCTWQ